MKKHGTQSIFRLPSVVKIALWVTPSTALAMGGEGLAEGILILVLFSVVWLIASVASFIPKTKPWTADRYALWAIRLSFPVWIAWGIIDLKYIDPYFGRLRHERNELLQDKARHEFSSLCEQHTPQATQILQVVNTEAPRRFFIDQPDDLSGLSLSLNLARCVTKQLAPACSSIKLESIEWASLHSKGMGPCKNGIVPDTNRCLPEYYRYELGERNFRVVAIDQPTSNYVIRVEKAVETGEKFEQKIRKHQITLETKETRQPLAKIEVLTNWVRSTPCPNPENEVAQMLLQVFPQRQSAIFHNL